MRFIYKFMLAACALLAGASAEAQNIQLHYDFGRHLYPEAQQGRPNTMITIEQQSVDKFGDTFYFADFTFKSQGAVTANWKFLRNLKFWNGPLAWHLRYDGGMRFVNTGISDNDPRAAISIKDAFFTGMSYTYLSVDRKLMLQGIGAYKYIKQHDSPHNWEATLVWKYAPGNGVFSATGFVTFWREGHQWRSPMGVESTQYKFMTQPQFWCNLNKIKGVSEHLKLSIGTEVRISQNVDAKQWIVAPTLALKWNFGK